MRREAESKEDAFSRILRLVSVRERSSYELRERLSAEGYAHEEIDEAMERAVRLSLCDDARYAAAYVRSALARNDGIAGIRRHLDSCDIASDIIDSAFEQADACPDDFDAEVLRAQELLDRKHPSGSNVRNKAYCALMRRGFASSVSSTAARIWCDRMNS